MVCLIRSCVSRRMRWSKHDPEEMTAFIKIILVPFLLIGILSFGAVEGFYRWLEKELTINVRPRASLSDTAVVPAGEGVIDRLSEQDDVSLIIERNLFAARTEGGENLVDRDVLEDLELSSLDVVLMGTVFGVDGSERAIIYDKEEKKQELYQIGDYIQQATIRKILRGKVILSYNGKDEMLDISEARNVVTPRVARPLPVVTKKKVTGRPVGQSAAGGGKTITPGASPQSTANAVQQPLRSFSGGVTVRSGAKSE